MPEIHVLWCKLCRNCEMSCFISHSRNSGGGRICRRHTVSFYKNLFAGMQKHLLCSSTLKHHFSFFKKWPDGDTEIIGSQSCSKIQSILFKEPTRKQKERNRNINRIPLKSYINPVRAHERENQSFR